MYINLSQNCDMTAKECKKAWAAREVILVQANPNDMSIFFLTKRGDLGFIVTRPGGPLRRYKSHDDRAFVILKIKGY